MKTQDLYNLEVEIQSGPARVSRVGLLQGTTGIPVALLYLQSNRMHGRHELYSARDVESFILQSTDQLDREAWESLLPFFEMDGSRILVAALPRSSERTQWLSDFIGVDRGLQRRTGIHAIREYREIADVVIVPQASRLLTSEEHRQFYLTLLDSLANDPHFFVPIDFPAGFTSADCYAWLRGVLCPDAAAFFPWLVIRDRLIPPAASVAAVIQISDRVHGIHHLPVNQILRGGAFPLMEQTPGEVSESLRQRLNVFHHFSDGTTRIWGGNTLADRFDNDSRFISTRRTALAIREAVHRVCEPFVLEPLSYGLDKTIDVALHSAFQPLLRFFDPEAKAPFETSVRTEAKRGQDIVHVDVRCMVPYALDELKFSLGLVA